MFIWLAGENLWRQIEGALSKLHPDWKPFGAAEFIDWTQAYGLEAIVDCLLSKNGKYDLKGPESVRPSFGAK